MHGNDSSITSPAWFGLSKTTEYHIWSDLSSHDPSSDYHPSVIDGSEDCYITASDGSWTTDPCYNIRNFVCQYSTNISESLVTFHLVFKFWF